MEDFLPADGFRILHEAVYAWVYALLKGGLARLGIMLSSRRTAHCSRRKNGLLGVRVVGMRSVHGRPEEALDRWGPGHWEGDLVIGKGGETTVITPVNRQSRFTTILALPQGRKADHVADVLIEHVSGLLELVRNSLT